MTNELFIKIVSAILTIMVALITGFLIPWLKTKFNGSQLAQIREYTEMAVRCAEQIYTPDQWEQKKEYVLQYVTGLVNANFKLSLTDEDFKHVLTYEEDCLLCDTMGFPKISKERFEQEQSRNKETIGSLFDPMKMKPKFIEFLKKLGYDGIAIPEDHQYGVFEPNQIHIIKDDIKGITEELKKVLEIS